MVALSILVTVGALLVLSVWSYAAWRSYRRSEDFDLTRLNTVNWFPYGFPLVLPIWMLRRREGRHRPPPVGRDETKRS